MKLCPACQTQYTDDTLQFCLQDGTPLTFASQADTPTAVLNEIETKAVVGGGKFQVPIGNVSSGQQPSGYGAALPEKKGTNTAMAVALTVVGMLLFFVVVGIAAWVYLRNPKQTASNTNAPAKPAAIFNSNLVSTPKTTRPSPTPVATNNTGNTSTTVDDSQVKGEVQQRISNWKLLVESKDMSGLRALYAPVLDYYYNKRNISSGNAVADKERAFRNYSSLRINISNVRVTADPSGDTATALYNKDWTFDGIKPFCGEIQSQMQLRNINGVWLIIGEKDTPGTFRRTC